MEIERNLNEYKCSDNEGRQIENLIVDIGARLNVDGCLQEKQ